MGESVYVLGGSAAGEALAVVEEYEPGTNRWHRRDNMPAARELFGAAVVDDKIYVIGGTRNGFDKMARVDIYAPAENRWSRGEDMPTARSALSVVAVGGKIYAIGGWGADTDMSIRDFGAVEVYDPRTDTWVTAAEMPRPRSHMAAAAVGGKIYLMGGWVRRGGEEAALATVEVYDVVADAWTVEADLPTPRWLSASAVFDGRIYVFGGWTTGGENRRTTLASVDVFDPTSGLWGADSDLPGARVAHSVAAIGGRFYVLGGVSGPTARDSAALARVDVYRPSDPSLLSWIPEAERDRRPATPPLEPASVSEFKDGGAYGRIVEVEAPFGNLVTSFVESDMRGLGIALGSRFSVRFGDRSFNIRFGNDFSDVGAGEWVAVMLSSGNLTIAVYFADAHEACGCAVGDSVFIAASERTPPGAGRRNTASR